MSVEQVEEQRVEVRISEEAIHRIACFAEVIAIGGAKPYQHRNRQIDYVPDPEEVTSISEGIALVARAQAEEAGREEVNSCDIQQGLEWALETLPSEVRGLLMAALQNQQLDSPECKRAFAEMKELGMFKDGGPMFTDRIERLMAEANLYW